MLGAGLASALARVDGRPGAHRIGAGATSVGIRRPAAELALGARVPAAADLGRRCSIPTGCCPAGSGGSSLPPPVRGSSCSPSVSASTRRTSRARSRSPSPSPRRAWRQVLAVAAAVLLVPASVASVWSLVLRLRRSQGFVGGRSSSCWSRPGRWSSRHWRRDCSPRPADVLIQAAAVALVPIAIGVAVTRHRLYDLDTAVCRALVTASLAVCLIGVYLSVFAVLQAVGDERSALSAAVAAGVTGALIHPLGRRLWAGADRLFYGDRADPYVVTSRLSSRLAAPGLDIAAIPEVVCETVVSSLRLGAAEVWLLVDGEERRLAGAGDATTSGERFAMRHRGETAGWLVVAPRPGEPLVTERDAQILAGIADLVAPSIAALQLHQELQRSRELLVAAREAERQRLRRELHDGWGRRWPACGSRSSPRRHWWPTRRRAPCSPPPVAASATRSPRSAPSPTGSGRRASTTSGSPVPWSCSRSGTAHPGSRWRSPSTSVGELGAATEVATYRIAAEALANVSRHAQATRLVLTLTRSADSLVLVVVDDGVGPDGGRDARSGIGPRHRVDAAARRGDRWISHRRGPSNPDRAPSCVPSSPGPWKDRDDPGAAGRRPPAVPRRCARGALRRRGPRRGRRGPRRRVRSRAGDRARPTSCSWTSTSPTGPASTPPGRCSGRAPRPACS